MLSTLNVDFEVCLDKLGNVLEKLLDKLCRDDYDFTEIKSEVKRIEEICLALPEIDRISTMINHIENRKVEELLKILENRKSVIVHYYTLYALIKFKVIKLREDIVNVLKELQREINQKEVNVEKLSEISNTLRFMLKNSILNKALDYSISILAELLTYTQLLIDFAKHELDMQELLDMIRVRLCLVLN